VEAALKIPNLRTPKISHHLSTVQQMAQNDRNWYNVKALKTTGFRIMKM
jgi:hypothetical protein